MGATTSIEWTDASWTPIRARNRATGKTGWHCTHVSEACRNCYAEGINKRLGTGLAFKPGHLKDVEIFLDEAMLLAPLSWRKPRKIFVCSMTDLFGDFISDEMIDKVFAVMALAPQHTFQVLTKRPGRMRRYMDSACGRIADTIIAMRRERGDADMVTVPLPHVRPGHAWWPLPNVWLGTSAEDQPTADARIPELLATPAAVRFVSLEPMLGPIDLHEFLLGFSAGHPAACSCGHGHGFDRCQNYGRVSPRCHRCECQQFRKAPFSDGLHWVICGGESGPHARPMHPDWARSLRDQCAAAVVPFFFKQWGEHVPGSDLLYDAKTFCMDRSGRTVRAPARAVDFPAGSSSGDGWAWMRRVGKARAGRILDGRTHDDLPAVRP